MNKNNTEIQLGSPPEPAPGTRDALHVPVIVVLAHRILHPGQAVGIRGDSTEDGTTGVTDPFLTGLISAGERVAVLLRPNSTTDVRHVWEHPDITAGEPSATVAPDEMKEISRGMTMGEWDAYADNVAEKLGCDRHIIDGSIEHMLECGTSDGGYQPNLMTTGCVDWVEFWGFYNASHGTKLGHTEDPFCC